MSGIPKSPSLSVLFGIAPKPLDPMRRKAKAYQRLVDPGISGLARVFSTNAPDCDARIGRLQV